MPGTSEFDFDGQDQSEAFDETNLDDHEELNEMRTFEEMPEVLDLTTAVGDRDDDEALAMDADEFDEDAIDDGDTEEDNELDYRASDEEHEDDLDGLGAEAGSRFIDEDAVGGDGIEGLDTVLDADGVEGGEDDFTNFQSKTVSDADLETLGYSENRKGEILAKPDEA